MDGRVFTDMTCHEDAEELKKYAAQNDFVVLFGLEVYTDTGHLLVYVPDYNMLASPAWAGPELPRAEEVIAMVRGLGGAAVAAHPYCREYAKPMGDNIFTLKGLAGIESENSRRGKMTNDLAAEAAFSMQLSCCGGSDSRQDIETIGAAATFLKKKVTTEAELVEVLLSGNFWPVKIGEFPPKEAPRTVDGNRAPFRRDERGRDNRGGGYRNGGGRDGGRGDRRGGPAGGGGGSGGGYRDRDRGRNSRGR
jgi:hypothetical protein